MTKALLSIYFYIFYIIIQKFTVIYYAKYINYHRIGKGKAASSIRCGLAFSYLPCSISCLTYWYSALCSLSQVAPYPSEAGVTGLLMLFFSSTTIFPSCARTRILVPSTIASWILWVIKMTVHFSSTEIRISSSCSSFLVIASRAAKGSSIRMI